MRKVLAVLGLAGMIAGGGVPALAANIVTNGDFETDDAAFASSSILNYATGWTVSGSAGETNAFPNNGSGSAFFGGGTSGGSLSQALSTTAGDTYNVTFYVGLNDFGLGTDPNAIFDATFGTNDLLVGASGLIAQGLTGADVGPAVGFSGYEMFTIDGVAPSSGGSTTLTFSGSTTGGDGQWYLDDVDVEAVPPVNTAAPEPSSLLLLLPVLAAIPLMRRRVA